MYLWPSSGCFGFSCVLCFCNICNWYESSAPVTECTWLTKIFSGLRTVSEIKIEEMSLQIHIDCLRTDWMDTLEALQVEDIITSLLCERNLSLCFFASDVQVP